MIVRIILFLSLCSTAVLSMLIGTSVELRIANYYVSNWIAVGIIYRILIFTALYVGFCILAGAKNKGLKVGLLLFIGAVLIDILLSLAGHTEFHSLFIHPLYQVASYSSIAALFACSFVYLTTNKETGIKKWLYFALVIPTIALSFIKIIYRDDWMNVASNANELTLAQTSKMLALDENLQHEILVPFLSTGCSSCRLSATKMGVSYKNNVLPPTHLVFYQKEDEVQSFLNETGLQGLKFTVLPKDTFFKYSGFRLPSIFYVEKQQSTQWIGEQFNNVILYKLAEKVN